MRTMGNLLLNIRGRLPWWGGGTQTPDHMDQQASWACAQQAELCRPKEKTTELFKYDK